MATAVGVGPVGYASSPVRKLVSDAVAAVAGHSGPARSHQPSRASLRRFAIVPTMQPTKMLPPSHRVNVGRFDWAAGVSLPRPRWVRDPW